MPVGKLILVAVLACAAGALVAWGITWGVMREHAEDEPDITTTEPPETETPTEPPELPPTEPPPPPPPLPDLDWWETTVLYQIYPRSFKDSDGDGIGDLQGITSQLDHFVYMGVKAIWLSPIFTSPMVDFGYDISDFYNIQPEYGTMEDFEHLVERCHELGIKLLLDFVPNHASDQSQYFINSVQRVPGYEDFFVWDDGIEDGEGGRIRPSNWVSQFGGSQWTWNEQRQQFYLHQFAVEQPDFNFRNPAVVQEMHNIIEFWMDKGADGFRVDAIPHLFEADRDENGRFPDEPLSGWGDLTPDQVGYTTQIHTRDQIELYDVVYGWRTFMDEYSQSHGGNTRVMLTEAYANVTMTMLYYGDNEGRIGAHFPFNFDFINELWDGSSARDFVYTILRWLTYMPYGARPNWVFGNHDNSRMPSRFRESMVDGLNALNMMLPGVAVTYQGEEIGMLDGFVSWEDTVDVAAINQGNEDNYLEYSRDPARTPFHWDTTTSAGFSTSEDTWLPVSEHYLTTNVLDQRQTIISHLNVYQGLVSLRLMETLRHGELDIRALSDRTLVLVRYLTGYETVALVFNVAETPDTVFLDRVPLLPEQLTVELSSVGSARLPGSTVARGQQVLAPGEMLVLRGSTDAYTVY